MDKYTLLVLLNTPFVIYGIVRVVSRFRKRRLKLPGLLIRLSFWVLIFAGLFFVREIYDFLVVRGLTDSTPLSIADVVLVTGINYCLFLILRLYTKLDNQERQFAEFHEKLSIELSRREARDRKKK